MRGETPESQLGTLGKGTKTVGLCTPQAWPPPPKVDEGSLPLLSSRRGYRHPHALVPRPTRERTVVEREGKNNLRIARGDGCLSLSRPHTHERQHDACVCSAGTGRATTGQHQQQQKDTRLSRSLALLSVRRTEGGQTGECSSCASFFLTPPQPVPSREVRIETMSRKVQGSEAAKGREGLASLSFHVSRSLLPAVRRRSGAFGDGGQSRTPSLRSEGAIHSTHCPNRRSESSGCTLEYRLACHA